MENGVHAKLTGAGGEGGCVIGIMIPGGDNKNNLTIHLNLLFLFFQ